MMNILIFGGTTEGSQLALWLAEKCINVTVSVATEYGRHFVPSHININSITGRLNKTQIADFIRKSRFFCVIDATHPYATEVTDNIRFATELVGNKLIRICRDEDGADMWQHVNSAVEAAEILGNTYGNILLTTGSKDLEVFASKNLTHRCIPRVLPSLESLQKCLDLGYLREKIICMQGPFSKELNIATISQMNVKIVVTKSSGKAGGFEEKSQAALETGCNMIIIDRNKKETGYSVHQAKKLLNKYIGGSI